jgi:hypothetical protein
MTPEHPRGRRAGAPNGVDWLYEQPVHPAHPKSATEGADSGNSTGSAGRRDFRLGRRSRLHRSPRARRSGLRRYLQFCAEPRMTDVRERPSSDAATPPEHRRIPSASAAEAEATSISRATAVIAVALIATAGVFAAFGLLQVSGVALLAALAMSIASVVGRPTRGFRWVGPGVVGIALLTVILTSFISR